MDSAISNKKRLRNIFDNANRCLYVTIGMERKTAHAENQYAKIITSVDDWLYQCIKVYPGWPMNAMKNWRWQYV